MSDTGRYLYAIARPVGDDVLGGLRGVAGEPIRAVAHRDLVAVVGTVETGTGGGFGEDALSEHLNDLRWLDAMARAHHGVVDGVARAVPTAPLRLATICADDDGVRDRLTQWYDGFQQALDAVAGRAEWSVKVYAPAQADAEHAPTATAGTPGSGAAYLRSRRAAATRREDALATAMGAADDAHDTLTRCATDARRLAAQDQRLTGSDTPMSLNGAYLVADDRAGDFQDAVDRLRQRHPGCRLDLAGPWPAYSFVTVEGP